MAENPWRAIYPFIFIRFRFVNFLCGWLLTVNTTRVTIARTHQVGESRFRDEIVYPHETSPIEKHQLNEAAHRYAIYNTTRTWTKCNGNKWQQNNETKTKEKIPIAFVH